VGSYLVGFDLVHFNPIGSTKRKSGIMELYKKYRPTRLSDIVGNTTSIKILNKYLGECNLPHTILLSGISGSGKTTIARILKTKLQCSDTDFVEINCADFRGIDTIREIREQMSYVPLEGKCRIWLIDECARLSNDAQNAILKMLEDTPQHVYFFLATTEPEKLIKAIRTRCCEIALEPLSVQELEKLLSSVITAEKIKIKEDCIEYLAEKANGSARMALVYLDKIIGLPEAEIEDAIKNIELEQTKTIELCRALLAPKASKYQWSTVSKILSGLTDDPESTRRAVLGYAAAVLLKTESERASRVIDYFEEPFWNAGKPALINASYKVVNS
jgi:DNA polymerase III gamma/tau subunit